ncbi:MAG: hypothetical protein NTX16_09540 [Actinobacteria bacterium]|nr:hypothetical protein [Actinomycetota bacterium]
MNPTRLLTGLVTVTAVALAAAPAIVVFGLGWLTLGPVGVPTTTTVPPDTTSPEQWVLFALFYLAWMLGLMVLLIWTYDRLGRNWRSWDRAPRRETKRRRRLGAGLSYLEGQEKARRAGKKGGT